MVVIRLRTDLLGLVELHIYHREELIEENGNGMWHGEKIENFWNTDMQLAIQEKNHRNHTGFLIRTGKVGISQPYQQVIPMEFARKHRNLYNESIKLEGPTGKTWTTVIRSQPKKVQFGRGWRQFSEDNRLHEGHQLLFTLVETSHFLVEFFDRLCRRCIGYPPRSVDPPGQTQRHGARTLPPESDLRQLVDGGQSSHGHIKAGQTAGADPTGAQDSDMATVSLCKRKTQLEVANLEPNLPSKYVKDRKKRTLDERIGLPTMDDGETHHQETDAVAETDKFICLDSDDSDAEDTPSAPKPPFAHPQPITGNLNVHSKPAGFHSPANKSRPRQIQDPISSSGHADLQEPPRKVLLSRARAEPPVSSYNWAENSTKDTPAELLLKRQGCMRYSDLVRKSERQDVTDLEKHVAVAAGMRFASTLTNEYFVVVLRAEQVYHGFHLGIPDWIVKVTGAERASKVNGWLMDGKNLITSIHWERPVFGGEPWLDCDAWAKFAVDHLLEEGDLCVFELRQSDCPAPTPSFLFKLHIFPVEGPRLGPTPL